MGNYFSYLVAAQLITLMLLNLFMAINSQSGLAISKKHNFSYLP
jgi:hypothetical protein